MTVPARGVDPLGFVAIGVALPLGIALVEADAKKALAFELHRQVERPGEDRRHLLGAVSDQLFQNSPTAVTFRSSIRLAPWLLYNPMDYPKGLRAPAPQQFPDLTLHHPGQVETLPFSFGGGAQAHGHVHQLVEDGGRHAALGDGDQHRLGLHPQLANHGHGLGIAHTAQCRRGKDAGADGTDDTGDAMAAEHV